MMTKFERAIARPLSTARSAAVARQKRAPRAIWCPYRVHPREGPKSLRNRNSGQQPAQTPPLHPVGACGANTGQGCVGFARSRTIRVARLHGTAQHAQQARNGRNCKIEPSGGGTGLFRGRQSIRGADCTPGWHPRGWSPAKRPPTRSTFSTFSLN